MILKNKKHIYAFAFIIILILLSKLIFTAQVERHEPDIYLHSRLVLQPWGAEIYSHILYFVLLEIVSGFSNNLENINSAAEIILIFFTALKFVLLFYIIDKSSNKELIVKLPWFPGGLAFLLSIIHAIPFDRHHLLLGYFPPNSWHNSTAIMQVPFALLQFYMALRLLKEYKIKDCIILSIFIIVSNLIKPNFFLCFAPAYLILLLQAVDWKLNMRFFLSLLPVFLGASILFAEYLVTYGESAGIGFGLFEVWNHLTTIKYWCLLGSFMFPLVYTFLNYNTLFKSRAFLFAILQTTIGLVIFFTLYEKGTRMYHANFIWQIIPSSLILFTVLVIHQLGSFSLRKSYIFQIKNLVSPVFFLLHVFAGIIYMYKIITLDIW